MAMGDREYREVELTPFQPGASHASVQPILANPVRQAYFHAQKPRVVLEQSYTHRIRASEFLELPFFTAPLGGWAGIASGYTRLRDGHNRLRATICFYTLSFTALRVHHLLSVDTAGGGAADSATATIRIDDSSFHESHMLEAGPTRYDFGGVIAANPFATGRKLHMTEVLLDLEDIAEAGEKRVKIFVGTYTEDEQTTAAVPYRPVSVRVVSAPKFGA